MSAVTCSLHIGGQVIADQPDDLRATTTALDGVSVTWGRDSVLDQPDAATASATISIPTGHAAAVLPALSVGTRMAILASATTWQATSATPIVTDWQNSHTLSGATRGGTRTRLTVDATHPATRRVVLALAPGPLQADGQGRAAWDTIARISDGGTWTLTATITDLPSHTTVSLAPVYYTGPWANTAQLGPTLATRTTPGTLTATITPPLARDGQWIGLALTAHPIGPTWQQANTTWADTPTTWVSNARLTLTNPAITPPKTGARQTATVFEGPVTDVSARWDSASATVIATLTAADFTSTLSNLRIGDQPWPEEAAADRAHRITDLLPVPVDLSVDTTLAATRLQMRDVDSTSAISLLDEIAVSTGGVLWSTTHATTGEYLWLEDPTQRPALQRLTLTGGHLTITPDASRALLLDASRVLLDSVTLTRDTSGAASVATVRWSDTETDDKGETKVTERTETLTNPDALSLLGYRTVSASTSLARQTDAVALAARLLALAAPRTWTLPSLTWDTDVAEDDSPADPATVLALLDATRRIAAPIILTSLPDWMPEGPALAGFCEGGTLTHEDGRWVIAMTITRPTTSIDSITWTQLPPPLTWDTTTLTWDETGTITA